MAAFLLFQNVNSSDDGAPDEMLNTICYLIDYCKSIALCVLFNAYLMQIGHIRCSLYIFGVGNMRMLV